MSGLSDCPSCGIPLPESARFCSGCGESLSEDGKRDPLLGRVLLGQYRVLRLLGSGAMGAVYLADQASVGRKAAIKVLRGTGVSDDPMALARFEREAHAASQLAHPNIITIYNLGKTDDGSPFIAMEYCEGKSLQQVLREERALAPDRVVRIAVQMLDALALAHDRGVIHRDLKPANMMLTTRGDRDDVVKLLDFGIAKLQSAEMTQSGVMLGTPLYMAPEQLGEGAIDGRADLYAVGVMLYEMLSGQLPISGNDLASLALKKVTKDPPALSAVTDGVISGALESVVMRALAREPRARHSDARTLAEALLLAVSGVRPAVQTKPLPAAAAAAASATIAQPIARRAPDVADDTLPLADTEPGERAADAPAPASRRMWAMVAMALLSLLVVPLAVVALRGKEHVFSGSGSGVGSGVGSGGADASTADARAADASSADARAAAAADVLVARAADGSGDGRARAPKKQIARRPPPPIKTKRPIKKKRPIKRKPPLGKSARFTAAEQRVVDAIYRQLPKSSLSRQDVALMIAKAHALQGTLRMSYLRTTLKACVDNPKTD